MKPLHLILITSLLALSMTQCLHAADTANDGFKPIFDGKSLTGWSGDPTYWRVEDGKLVGEVTPETVLKRNTFLIWQLEQPADFELKMEYRISARGNSGVNYRSELIDQHPFALKGYQADIDGANRYTGQNYEEGKRTTLAYAGQKTSLPKLGEISSEKSLKTLRKRNAWTPAIVTETFAKRPALTAHIKDDDWNQIHIIAQGNRMQHYVNGVLMSEVTDNDTIHRRDSGYIGMQVHVGPPMKVEFRGILLKHL